MTIGAPQRTKLVNRKEILAKSLAIPHMPGSVILANILLLGRALEGSRPRFLYVLARMALIGWAGDVYELTWEWYQRKIRGRSPREVARRRDVRDGVDPDESGEFEALVKALELYEDGNEESARVYAAHWLECIARGARSVGEVTIHVYEAFDDEEQAEGVLNLLIVGWKLADTFLCRYCVEETSPNQTSFGPLRMAQANLFHGLSCYQCLAVFEADRRTPDWTLPAAGKNRSDASH